MANKDIQESQQSSQGIALGTQGNQAGSIPDGVKGTHHSKENQQDVSIPNQERSSASKQQQQGERDQGRH
jgi:hypothetical protein